MTRFNGVSSQQHCSGLQAMGISLDLQTIEGNSDAHEWFIFVSVDSELPSGRILQNADLIISGGPPRALTQVP